MDSRPGQRPRFVQTNSTEFTDALEDAMIPLHCSPMNDRDAWKTEGICPDCASAILARAAKLEHWLQWCMDNCGDSPEYNFGTDATEKMKDLLSHK